MNSVAEIDAAIEHLQALKARLLEPAATVEYTDQDDHERLERSRVTRRMFLEAARRNEFENEKIGRKVRTKVSTFEAWLSSRRRQPKVVETTTDTDVTAAIDLAAERMARRAGGRR